MNGELSIAVVSVIYFNICNKYGMFIGDGLMNYIIYCKWF